MTAADATNVFYSTVKSVFETPKMGEMFTFSNGNNCLSGIFTCIGAISVIIGYNGHVVKVSSHSSVSVTTSRRA